LDIFLKKWLFYKNRNLSGKFSFQTLSRGLNWRQKHLLLFSLIFGTTQWSIFQTPWFNLKIIFTYWVLKSGLRIEIVLFSNIISHWKISKRILVVAFSFTKINDNFIFLLIDWFYNYLFHSYVYFVFLKIIEHKDYLMV
jgi:hypothetical protein